MTVDTVTWLHTCRATALSYYERPTVCTEGIASRYSALVQIGEVRVAAYLRTWMFPRSIAVCWNLSGVLHEMHFSWSAICRDDTVSGLS